MRNKFLNFTICQIFIIIEVSLQCVMCQGRQENSPAQNVSYYERSFKKVLSRRKRFLVWRPGSNVLLTSSLAKPLAFEKPTGHNYIMEWDIFFPLPTSWRVPTKKPKTTTPPPTEETTLEVTHSWDPHSDSTGEIWMPSSGWAPGTDVIKAISHGKEADKRLWNSPWQQQQTLRESNWNDNNLFRLPSSLPVTQFKNPLLHNKTPWQQTLQQMTFNRNDRTNFNHQHYQSNRQPLSSNVERNFIGIDKQQQRRRFITKGRSLETLSEFRAMKKREVEESIEDDDDYWEHHHAHRDRRELYNLVESTSPLSSIDVKSCLLRMICEAQNFLLPPGYSMFQDMLRIVFTVPIRDDLKDDYSNAMREAKDQDCFKVYSERCPISILAFLLYSKH